jgi:hypothetical protein
MLVRIFKAGCTPQLFNMDFVPRAGDYIGDRSQSTEVESVILKPSYSTLKQYDIIEPTDVLVVCKKVW